jgi:hypothetical protein
MVDKKKSKKQPVDPYTGEEKPPAEDAGKIIEIVPVDSGDRKGQNYLMEEESSMDSLAADEDADAVARRVGSFTEDEEIKTHFEERQHRAVSGRKELEEKLEDHHAESPKLSGGDLDAAWQFAGGAGEEAVGGSTPTPDQDMVDELGEAIGITYEDDEPISGEEKILRRDRHRWELDPKSADTLESSTDEDEN